MSLSFLLTSLIVVVSPGTGVLYTLAAALTKGSRASIAAAFGCTLGILPHLAAAMLGRGAARQRAGVRGAEMVRRDLPALYGVADLIWRGRPCVNKARSRSTPAFKRDRTTG